MDRASEIKRLVTMRQVLDRYGYDVNRAGFMRCPFHSGDHTASLKIYQGDRGWHCFGCHKGGSVIDFVMEHDGVSFQAACKTLDAMFSLNLYRELSFSEYRKAQRQRERAEADREKKQQAEADDRHCRDVLGRYFRWLWMKPEKTESMNHDLEYLDRILSQDAPLQFDPIARVNAMISKHIERGGSYSCIREIRPDDGAGACP